MSLPIRGGGVGTQVNKLEQVSKCDVRGWGGWVVVGGGCVARYPRGDVYPRMVGIPQSIPPCNLFHDTCDVGKNESFNSRFLVC